MPPSSRPVGNPRDGAVTRATLASASFHHGGSVLRSPGADATTPTMSPGRASAKSSASTPPMLCPNITCGRSSGCPGMPWVAVNMAGTTWSRIQVHERTSPRGPGASPWPGQSTAATV